jgi:hypothetical protein
MQHSEEIQRSVPTRNIRLQTLTNPFCWEGALGFPSGPIHAMPCLEHGHGSVCLPVASKANPLRGSVCLPADRCADHLHAG